MAEQHEHQVATNALEAAKDVLATEEEPTKGSAVADLREVVEELVNEVKKLVARSSDEGFRRGNLVRLGRRA